VVLPTTVLKKFTHSFLVANCECHASAGCDTVMVHIKPVAAKIANIASVVVFISIAHTHRFHLSVIGKRPKITKTEHLTITIRR
jgi:hypothetical protein